MPPEDALQGCLRVAKIVVPSISQAYLMEGRLCELGRRATEQSALEVFEPFLAPSSSPVHVSLCHWVHIIPMPTQWKEHMFATWRNFGCRPLGFLVPGKSFTQSDYLSAQSRQLKTDVRPPSGDLRRESTNSNTLSTKLQEI
eukprot:3328841-Amphidinium_carterae.2